MGWSEPDNMYFLSHGTITFIVHYSRHKKENQIEEAKKGITQKKKKTKQGHVTLSTALQSTALTLNFLAASMA